MHRTDTAVSDRSDVTLAEGEEHPNPLGNVGGQQCQGGRGPATELVHDRGNYCGRLRGKTQTHSASTIGVLTGPFVDGRRDSRLVGSDGERVLCDQICQQGVDGSDSVAHCAGDCRYVGGFAELEIDYNGFLDCVTAVNVSVKELSSAFAVGSTIVSSSFFASWIHNHGFLCSKIFCSSFPLSLSSHG